MPRTLPLILLAALVAAAPARLDAWGFPAHRHVIDRMIALLPPELQPFFDARRTFIVERVVDPDLWRNVGWDEEPPNHFIDLDYEAYGDLPVRRAAARVRPGGAEVRRAMVHEQGLLPWRTAEFYGRLQRAFEIAVAPVAVALRPRRHRPLLGDPRATTWPTVMCRCTPTRTTTAS